MPVSSRLKRLVTRRIQALYRHLPGAVSGDVRDVHQARVASRRLRELLPVFASGLPGAKARSARRMLRRVTRALGGVREIDVSLVSLADVRDPAVSRATAEAVQASLRHEREARRHEMLARLGRIDTLKLKVRLERIAACVDGPEREPIWRSRLSRRLTTRASALEDAIAHAGPVYAAEPLHAVRIAVKKLRYTLELADESGAGPARAMVRTLKAAQDTLGHIHDLVVLTSHTSAMGAAGNEPRVGPEEIAGLAHSFEEECRRLHAHYVASIPSLAALCADVASNLAPDVRPPAGRLRRRTPLKMTLTTTAPRRRVGRAIERRR
jgi:CHAD domain-containing protein